MQGIATLYCCTVGYSVIYVRIYVGTVQMYTTRRFERHMSIFNVVI
jgi:hypothetical protein